MCFNQFLLQLSRLYNYCYTVQTVPKSELDLITSSLALVQVLSNDLV